MNSRYGLFVISTCWIGLAGCATMNQNGGLLSNNRLFNNRTGPGNAAMQQPAAPVFGVAPGAAPGTTFNNEAMAPPPPPPPPDFSAPARLDLSDAAVRDSGPVASASKLASASSSSSAKKSTSSPVPSKMYNLESSSRKVASSAKSRSTIDKLAEKSKQTASKAVAAKPGASSSSASGSSGSGLSTLARLSADAEGTRKEAAPQVAAPPVQAPAPAAVPDDLPAPAAAPAAPALPAPAAPTAADGATPLVDTALLAAPVRKGSSDEKNAAKDEEDGRPQSNVLPGSRLFSPDNQERMIYPVSNPAAKPEVDLTSIS